MEYLAKALAPGAWKEAAAWLAFGKGENPVTSAPPVRLPPVPQVVVVDDDEGDYEERVVAAFYKERVKSGEPDFQLSDLKAAAVGKGKSATITALSRALRKARDAGLLSYKIVSRADSSYSFVLPHKKKSAKKRG